MDLDVGEGVDVGVGVHGGARRREIRWRAWCWCIRVLRGVCRKLQRVVP